MPLLYPPLLREKFQADIVGREGLLPVEFDVAAKVTYMDGVADGEEYSLEIEGDTAAVSQAEVFDIRSVRWETS